MSFTIGKYFIFYDTILDQQRYCFFRSWDNLGMITAILQPQDLWTNNIRYPSYTYDVDIKLTFLEVRSVFLPPSFCWDVSRFPFGVPITAPFRLYYYHRSMKNAKGNSILLWDWLFDIELTVLSTA